VQEPGQHDQGARLALQMRQWARIQPRLLSSDRARRARARAVRSVYERAFRSLREVTPDAKEEAVMLLEAWRAFEAGAAGGGAGAAAVERRMPKRIKRKRPIATEDGGDAGMEEYYDYIFPDEAGAAPNLKLLEAAQRWKRAKLEAAADGGGSGGGGGE